MTALLDNIYF